MKNTNIINEFLYYIDTYYDNNEETEREEFSLNKKQDENRKTYTFIDKRNIDKDGFNNTYMITNNLITINLKNTKRFNSTEEMSTYIEDITNVLNNSIDNEKVVK